MNLNPIVRKVRNQLFNLSSPIQGGPYRRPQPSCWFCFAGSSPRAAAMQVAIHQRKLPAASCEGMDIWVVQNGDWFTKKWQKTTGFHGQAAKIVRISWLLLFWKATSTPLALEIERRFKCSPFGARGVWWFQNRKACCQRSAEITNCLYIFIVFRRYITWSYVFCCPCTSTSLFY